MVLLAAILLLLLGAAVVYATRHLATFAKWALERTFPGASVEMRALDYTFPSRLDIKSLVLKSRKDEKILLSLENGRVAFDFDDLRRRQIGEVRLAEPVIYASPRLTEAFMPSSEAPQKKSGAPWSVRRLVCDYGKLIITGYGGADLAVQTKFAFDFRDFSPGNAAGEQHSFALWDFSAASGSDPPFLSLDLVEGRFTLGEMLAKRTVSDLSLKGGNLIIGDSLRKIFATPKESTAMPQQPWVLGALKIQGVDVTVDDERPEITDITFALNTTLKNIPLAQTASALGSESQSIIVRNLEILSPRDPLTRVLTLRKVQFTFTLAGLLRRELGELEITEPTIYIGEDLFWYMEDTQKRLGTADNDGTTGPGWEIGMLNITSGRLVIGSGGRREYGLPLNFWAYAENVALDNLASLKLDTELKIPEQKYTFADYQLEFTGGGTLRFSYPPEKQEKNLVGEVKLQDVRWRQYQASDCYVAVTFDKKGINGLFGGSLYRGQGGGGFSFFFDPAAPWIGWLYGIKIDLRRLTNVVSPQNFQMTGPLDFKLQMDAFGKNIERVSGDLQAPKPGKLVIRKLDDLLARIPPEWPQLKQSSTRIALEALRDFEYDKGSGDFWFVRSQGILQLKLQGPQGSRNFDIVLHSNDSPQGRWMEQEMTKSE